MYTHGAHHTGNMHLSFDRISETVKEGGKLFIAIYNDQGRRSRFWKSIKKMYMILPRAFRFLLIVPFAISGYLPGMIYHLFRHGNPLYSTIRKKKQRGMSVVYDMFDWLGGYPYEVASPDVILDKFHKKGFELIKLKSTCGAGNNQFVFVKKKSESE